MSFCARLDQDKARKLGGDDRQRFDRRRTRRLYRWNVNARLHRNGR